MGEQQDQEPHEALVKLALEGGSLEEIIRRLESIAGRTAVLAAAHGGILASTSGPGPAASRPASGEPASDSLAGGLTASDVALVHSNGRPTPLENIDGVAVIGMPIAAGRRRVGVLLLDGHTPPDEDLLSSAALALAIAAARRDAEAAVVAEQATWLVSELRYGSPREPPLVRRSAERFGLNLDQPHAAAAFRHAGDNESSWNAAIRWIETPTEQRGDTAWTLVTGDCHAELSRIRDRLAGIVGRADRVVAVCGSVVTSIDQTSRSFREAELLLELAVDRCVDLLTPAMSGIDTLLIALDPRHVHRFIQDTLAPLLDYPPLIDTLEAWLDAEGSRAAVADALFVHRNTVGYRLKRIQEILAADLQDPRVRLRLRTAIAAHRLSGMISAQGAPQH